MKDEEDEFEKWFKKNEKIFHDAQYSDKDIGYAAWLEGRNYGEDCIRDYLGRKER